MNVVIVHGGPLTKTPQEPHNLHELYWQPWVTDELRKKGVSCNVPAMPNPWFPVYEDWKAEFEKQTLNEDTVLVGHSRGAAFLIRWLGENDKNFQKLLLVAPNLRSESKNPTICEFYNYQIEQTIKSHIPGRIVFTSENDDTENIESAKMLEEKLDCRLINLPEHGHYITEDMGTNQFPELVECVVN